MGQHIYILGVDIIAFLFRPNFTRISAYYSKRVFIILPGQDTVFIDLDLFSLENKDLQN